MSEQRAPAATISPALAKASAPSHQPVAGGQVGPSARRHAGRGPHGRSTDARSGTLPPENTSAQAAEARAKPKASDALRSSRRTCLRSSAPQRSMASRMASGTEALSWDCSQDLGLAVTAGISVAGPQTVAPPPDHDLGRVAAWRPRSSMTSTLRP